MEQKYDCFSRNKKIVNSVASVRNTTHQFFTIMLKYDMFLPRGLKLLTKLNIFLIMQQHLLLCTWLFLVKEQRRYDTKIPRIAWIHNGIWFSSQENSRIKGKRPTWNFVMTKFTDYSQQPCYSWTWPSLHCLLKFKASSARKSLQKQFILV